MVPHTIDFTSIAGVSLDSPRLQTGFRERMVKLEKCYSHDATGLSVQLKKSIKVESDQGFVSFFVSEDLRQTGLSVEDARHLARILIKAADEAEAAAFRAAGYVKVDALPDKDQA